MFGPKLRSVRDATKQPEENGAAQQSREAPGTESKSRQKKSTRQADPGVESKLAAMGLEVERLGGEIARILDELAKRSTNAPPDVSDSN